MIKHRYDEDFKKQLVKIYNQGNHTYRDPIGSRLFLIPILTAIGDIPRYSDAILHEILGNFLSSSSVYFPMYSPPICLG